MSKPTSFLCDLQHTEYMDQKLTEWVTYCTRSPAHTCPTNSYTTCALTLVSGAMYLFQLIQESWSGNETTHANNIPYLTVIPVQGHFLLLWSRPWFQWECMWHRVSSEQFGYTSPPKNSWSLPLNFPRSCSYWWESEHTLHASCTGTPEEKGKNVTQLLDSH